MDKSLSEKLEGVFKDSRRQAYRRLYEAAKEPILQ